VPKLWGKVWLLPCKSGKYPRVATSLGWPWQLGGSVSVKHVLDAKVVKPLLGCETALSCQVLFQQDKVQDLMRVPSSQQQQALSLLTQLCSLQGFLVTTPGQLLICGSCLTSVLAEDLCGAKGPRVHPLATCLAGQAQEGDWKWYHRLRPVDYQMGHGGRTEWEW
jgi:hypothetical protein